MSTKIRMTREEAEALASKMRLDHLGLPESSAMAPAEWVVDAVLAAANTAAPLAPIPIRLHCPDPNCNELHVDEGEFATKPHHTHSCQKCGLTWRPAVVPTVGVRFLPGFKNEER